MFGLHFIVKGKIAPKLGRFYNQLFNDRLTGDYDDFIIFDKEMLDEIYPQADDFVQKLSEIIHRKQT